MKKHKSSLKFVVQKHAAKQLHYDFRLELRGVLKSWAIPKEISLDPAVKRLAIHVDDHDLEYGSFEGTIPEGHYGAGTVKIWDHGTYEPTELDEKKDPEKILKAQFAQGELKFVLSGKKLKGEFALVKMKKNDPDDKHWLLIKKRDKFAKDEP